MLSGGPLLAELAETRLEHAAIISRTKTIGKVCASGDSTPPGAPPQEVGGEEAGREARRAARIAWRAAGLASASGSRAREARGAWPAASSSRRHVRWQPKSLPVDTVYSCGNPSCIKVNDPAADLAAVEATKYDLIYFGAAVFVFLARRILFFRKR